MTREQLERRRMAAAKDLQKGMKKAHVARKYGVTKTSVSRWAKTLEKGGTEALRARKPPGPKQRLSTHQEKRLVKMLLEGAEVHGWSTDLWTTKRVATLIEREFGISYHFNHVGKLLRRMGFSWQKPHRVAVEKDEARKEKWLRTTWVKVLKN